MNVYSLYRTHNHHFAIYGAMFLGQYTPALRAAQELIDTTPDEPLRIPSLPMARVTDDPRNLVALSRQGWARR